MIDSQVVVDMLMSTNGHRLSPLFFLAWFLPSFLSFQLYLFPTLFISKVLLFCCLLCFFFVCLFVFFLACFFSSSSPPLAAFFVVCLKYYVMTLDLMYDSLFHLITSYHIISYHFYCNLTLSYIILFHLIVGGSLSDWWIGSVCPYQELWQAWRCWVGCYNTERSDQSGERPTHYLFLSLPIFIIFFHFSFLDYWIHYYYLY